MRRAGALGSLGRLGALWSSGRAGARAKGPQRKQYNYALPIEGQILCDYVRLDLHMAVGVVR